MDMRFNISFQAEQGVTEELQEYVKAKLPELINEYFFENPAELNKIIRECLKGQLKAVACEIFQGKEIRNVLAERIMQTLEMPPILHKYNKTKEMTPKEIDEMLERVL